MVQWINRYNHEPVTLRFRGAHKITKTFKAKELIVPMNYDAETHDIMCTLRISVTNYENLPMVPRTSRRSKKTVLTPGGCVVDFKVESFDNDQIMERSGSQDMMRRMG